MRTLSAVSEHHLPMGAMDTIMELYEVFYLASCHPEHAQFAYQPVIPLYRKLTRLFGVQKASTILLLVGDEALPRELNDEL